MNQDNKTPEKSQDVPNNAAQSPDDLLPPVKPPSAGFLLQLFVVPGLIVLVIVMLWVPLSIVLGRSADPKNLIQGLESSGVQRWQKAKELADVLRDDRRKEVRQDHTLAKQLGQVLRRTIDGADISDEAITMRAYLCKAIGEFHVDDALPELLLACKTERSDEEVEVRLAAVEALALLTKTMREADANWLDTHLEVEKQILAMVNDDSDIIRSRAMFALGSLKTPAALSMLRKKADDPYPDTRYNAAVALAHQGDAGSVDTLIEMLDPDETAGVDLETLVRYKPAKRSVLIITASRAVIKLAEENPDADLSEIIIQLRRLVKADTTLREKAMLQPGAISEAQAALDSLK